MTENPHPTAYDVAVVGAGPVGLLLAHELALAGCSVLVLEREASPDSTWRTGPLALRGLMTSSVEALDRRGLLEEIREGAPKFAFGEAPGSSQRGPRAGHFAGIMLSAADVDLSRVLPYVPAGLGTQLPMPSNMGVIEAVLAEHAVKRGVRIVRGAPVTGLDQDGSGVTLHTGAGSWSARWAVGCDGGRSTVRRLAGFDFAGTEPEFTGYNMLADIPDVEKLEPGFHPTGPGMYIRMPAGGQIGMMDYDGGAYDRSTPPSREHLQEVLRRVSETDVTVNEVHRVTTFTDRARQATDYRIGRVLLAGDAAHIHSPLGGQGLNLGLGDAMNLGWKLAATVQGRAPEGLLDTYTAERHPVGARVLEWSRAQVASMRPDPHSQALHGVLRDLFATVDGATHVYAQISGAWIHYDLGEDAHPLAGRSAPDLPLAGGTRLAELLREGRGALVDLTPDGDLAGTVAPWSERLSCATGPAGEEAMGLVALLVRPDGTVAWAADADGVLDRGTLAEAAARWFGPGAR